MFRNVKPEDEISEKLINYSRDFPDKFISPLLEKKADVNYQDEFGRTPLLQACRYNTIEVVRLLLEQKANINRQVDKVGEESSLHVGDTALMWAAATGNVDIVSELLKYGADINLKNMEGNTALTFAKKDVHNKSLLVDSEAKAIPKYKGHTEVVNVIEEEQKSEKRKEIVESTFNLFSQQKINVPTAVNDYLVPASIAKPGKK